MAETGVRRLLLVTTNYAPEPAGTSRYATQIAEHWAAGGAEVHVLTGMPHYPAWRLDPAYAGKRHAEEERGGVRVHRHGHVVPARQTALRRAMFEVSLLRGGLSAAPRIEGLDRIDAVAAQMPSLAAGVVGARLAARYGVPFVPVVRNLLGARAAGARAVERQVLRRAAVVGASHETLVAEVAALGVPQERIRLVPNWALSPQASRPREQMRAMLGWRPTQTVLLHCGDPGDGHGLDLLVQAARTDPTLRVVVMGDATRRERLRATAGGLPPNLDIAPLPDEAELPDMLAAADVLAVTDPGVPAELTSCFAAGRPIVAAVPGSSGTARELARAGAGVVVPPGAPGPLLAATRTLAADPTPGTGGPAYAATHLTREAGLAGIDSLLAAALTHGPSAPPSALPAAGDVPPKPSALPAAGGVEVPPLPSAPPALVEVEGEVAESSAVDEAEVPPMPSAPPALVEVEEAEVPPMPSAPPALVEVEEESAESSAVDEAEVPPMPSAPPALVEVEEAEVPPMPSAPPALVEVEEESAESSGADEAEVPPKPEELPAAAEELAEDGGGVDVPPMPEGPPAAGEGVDDAEAKKEDGLAPPGR